MSWRPLSWAAGSAQGALSAVVLAAMTACGGGGGGSTAPTTPANLAPVVVAQVNGTSTASASTLFNTTGTTDSDGTIASRSWNYGDGSTGSVDSHVYAAAGTYTATLTVTDNQGASASKTITVTVVPAPNQTPVVAVQVSGSAVAAATTTFDTTGTADPDGTIAIRSWNYGDGSTGSVDSHVYAAAGTYTATLTVTDNQGASASKSLTVTVAAPNQPPVVAVQVSGASVAAATTTFNTTGTADPDGSIAARNWVYGDGSTGTIDSHVYAAAGTYNASLTVTDNLGATASKSVTVTVVPAPAGNLPPVADAAAATPEPVVFRTVNFDTTGTRDPDGRIVAAVWDYGDGQTGSSNAHTYSAAGKYTATYTVTDNGGAKASKAVDIVVAKCSSDGVTVAKTSPYYALGTVVCMQTSLGEVVFDVFSVQTKPTDPYAQITGVNFLRYVDEGFYNGTIFHRVFPQLPSPLAIVQAGGFTSGPTAKPPTHAAIQLESQTRLKNDQYTVAMARTNVADSATSQFFINFADNHGLDYQSSASPGYAVFGLVLPGSSRTVVDTIGAVPTTTKAGLSDVPVTDVTILGMVRLP
jgi:PKD repeat protein